MIGVTIFTMKRNGPDYVDQPKYNPILKRSILYNPFSHSNRLVHLARASRGVA